MTAAFLIGCAFAGCAFAGRWREPQLTHHVRVYAPMRSGLVKGCGRSIPLIPREEAVFLLVAGDARQRRIGQRERPGRHMRSRSRMHPFGRR